MIHRSTWIAWLLPALLALGAHADPQTQPAPGTSAPLSPQDLQVLQTASDFTERLDEAALYPLLQNAIWLSNQTAGTLNPDYAQLLAQPAAQRGQLFLIQGLLAAPPRPVGQLARSGPWDGRLQQWAIQIDPQTDRLAMVYLVDPPSDKERPASGAKVQVVGRFYKIWTSPRQSDRKKIDYPVFIGKTIVTLEHSTGLTLIRRPSSIVVAVVGVLGLAIFFLYLRFRATKSGRSAHEQYALRRQRRLEEQGQIVPSSIEVDTPPLASDPAAALQELERRKTPTNP